MDKPNFVENTASIRLYQGLQTWIGARKNLAETLKKLCPEKWTHIENDINKRIRFFAEELVEEIAMFDKDSKKIITTLH